MTNCCRSAMDASRFPATNAWNGQRLSGVPMLNCGACWGSAYGPLQRLQVCSQRQGRRNDKFESRNSQPIFYVNLMTIRYLGKTFLSSFWAPSHKWTSISSYFKITTTNGSWHFLPEMKSFVTENLKKNQNCGSHFWFAC